MGGSTHSASPASGGAASDHAAGRMLQRGSIVAERFVLYEYLGRGRYGHVYKALDRTWSEDGLEQFVALHVLDDRIHAQTRLLRKLESSYLQPHLWAHPNIAKIRGFGSDRGAYYLCTELLEGRSLRAVLDEIRPNLVSHDTAFTILQGVGDALTYAHADGVVHGDVRPEKVFVTADQSVKVLDLLPANAARSRPYFVEDTAPNGLFNPDPRDDVYGLACLAYELLSGVHPFNRASPLRALNDGVAPVPIAGLTAGQWAALARGLALRRPDRTRSTAELLAGLSVSEPAHDAAEPSAHERAESDADRIAADNRIAADTGMRVLGDESVSTRRDIESLAADAPATRHRSPRSDAETIRTDARAAHDRSPRRNAEAGPAEPDAGFRAGQRRERWDPSETVVPTQAVQAYRGDARRRGERHGPRSRVPLLAIAMLAALGATAYLYLSYESFRGAVGQVLAAAESALGAGVRDAPVGAEPERAGAGALETATVAPDPIVPAASSEAAGASVEPEREPVQRPTESGPPTAVTPAPATTGQARPAGAGETTEQLGAAETTERARATGASEPSAPTSEPSAAAAGANPPGSGIAAGDAPSLPPAAETGAAAGNAPAVIEPERFELGSRVVTISESQASAAAVINRRGGALAPTSVTWWTSDGTAAAGQDYADLGRQTATFAASQDTRTVLVPIIADHVIEERERFYVNVAVDAPGATARAPDLRLEVVIVDDDR